MTKPTSAWDQRLPAPYDHETYVNHPSNADVHHFDTQAAWQHYTVQGRREGRICSAISSRQTFTQLIPAELSALEIGPFFSPSLQRPEKNVFYLDCLTREELVRRAATIAEASVDAIPEIEYVWSGQPYAQLINRKFSVVFSSHNIEHQCCLITHLLDIESILTDDGAVFLAIPDKRYCFDHFLPETTITDIIDAWVEKRTRHSLKDILDHRFSTAHNDAKRHWQGDHGHDRRRVPLKSPQREAFLALVQRYRVTSEHFDVHAWKFTPQGFRTIVDNLFNLRLTSFQTTRVYPTVRNSNEFYIILTRGR